MLNGPDKNGAPGGSGGGGGGTNNSLVVSNTPTEISNYYN